MVNQNLKFYFADVMCELWMFLILKETKVAARVKSALLVLHAKGHANDCQEFSCWTCFMKHQ